MTNLMSLDKEKILSSIGIEVHNLTNYGNELINKHKYTTAIDYYILAFSIAPFIEDVAKKGSDVGIIAHTYNSSLVLLINYLGIYINKKYNSLESFLKSNNKQFIPLVEKIGALALKINYPENYIPNNFENEYENYLNSLTSFNDFHKNNKLINNIKFKNFIFKNGINYLKKYINDDSILYTNNLQWLVTSMEDIINE